MIGSHIEFGLCSDVNTSHFVTQTLVNHYKCAGVSCLPLLQPVFCPSDTQYSTDRIVGDPTIWPWYDPYDPASREYLGKYVLRMEGLSSSPYTRDITNSIAGSFAEACVRKDKELLVEGLMFAVSRRGMEYGKRWERDQLWRRFCGCDGANIVKLRTDCDDDLVELRGFTPRTGPNFDPLQSNGKCSDNVMRFTYTASLVDPFIYTKNFDIDNGLFDGDPLCESWYLEDEESHFCGPECCSVCIPTTNVLGLFDYGLNNCCYCRPLTLVRRTVQIPVPTTGEVGINLSLFSGSEGVENSRFLLIDSAEDIASTNTDYDRFGVLGGVEFAPIPANTLIKVDGRSRTITASCKGSSAWVYDLGGLPFSDLYVSSRDVRHKLWGVWEADYCNVSADTKTTVSAFRRF